MMVFRVFFLVCSIASIFYAAQAASARDMQPQQYAVLQYLDKITGRTAHFSAKIGQTTTWGALSIVVKACQKSLPIDTPESAAFIIVHESTPENPSVLIFSGWMFASSPALSAMDNPRHDVWLLACQDEAEDISTSKKSAPTQPSLSDEPLRNETPLD